MVERELESRRAAHVQAARVTLDAAKHASLSALEQATGVDIDGDGTLADVSFCAITVVFVASGEMADYGAALQAHIKRVLCDAAGVRDGSWGWGAAFLDVDNDGDQDIVQQNGFPTDDHFVDVPMRLFVNDGTGVYTDRACDASLDQGDQGRAVVPFDFDNDGDLDLLSTVNASAPRLLENTGAPGTWARIGLSDGLAPGNRLGIGSFIEVEAVQGGVIRRRDIHLNSNFSGVRVPEAHFGFGGHVGPLYEVRVTWPDGAQTLHTDVDTNQILVLSR